MLSSWTLTTPESPTSGEVTVILMKSDPPKVTVQTGKMTEQLPLVVHMSNCFCLTLSRFSYLPDKNWYPSAEWLPLSDNTPSIQRKPSLTGALLKIAYMCSNAFTSPSLHLLTKKHLRCVVSVAAATLRKNFDYSCVLAGFDDINTWWASTDACCRTFYHDIPFHSFEQLLCELSILNPASLQALPPSPRRTSFETFLPPPINEAIAE